MFTKVKGTYDLFGKDATKVAQLENYLREVASLYGFEEIRVPILASTELIHRSTGDSSDIVTKETFDFKDRGDRMLTLRPEGTAPVIRAVIENKLYANPLPLKLFYVGDMFRYERPQKGRYREFSQFGVEVIGSNSAYMDAEVIALANTIFNSLRIKNVKVKINTLGDALSHENYKNALKEYFKDKLDNLCEDCKKRFETNPLRILDCKVDQDNEVIKNAPKINDFLSNESIEDFNKVQEYLVNLNIPFEVDHLLVRGLDYYTNTVFEFVMNDSESGQSGTICGGGRYNNLMKELDGPDTPCVGFAFGLERLSQVIDERVDYTKKIMCQLIPIGDSAFKYLVGLLQYLRISGLTSEMNYEASSLKGHFKSADNNNARFIIIAGDDELKEKSVKIKDKQNDTEEIVKEDQILNYIIGKIRSSHSCSGDCGTCGEDCSSCSGSCGEEIEA